jgi:hypothetical protein
METMRVGTMDSGFTVFFLFICDVNINSLEWSRILIIQNLIANRQDSYV